MSAAPATVSSKRAFKENGQQGGKSDIGDLQSLDTFAKLTSRGLSGHSQTIYLSLSPSLTLPSFLKAACLIAK